MVLKLLSLLQPEHNIMRISALGQLALLVAVSVVPAGISVTILNTNRLWQAVPAPLAWKLDQVWVPNPPADPVRVIVPTVDVAALIWQVTATKDPAGTATPVVNVVIVLAVLAKPEATLVKLRVGLCGAYIDYMFWPTTEANHLPPPSAVANTNTSVLLATAVNVGIVPPGQNVPLGNAPIAPEPLPLVINR